jgi:competence protein ComEC
VLTLVRDPVRLLSARGSPFVLVDATADAVDGRPAHSPVLVVARGRGWVGLLPGQHVLLDAGVRTPHGRDHVTAVVLADRPPVLLGRPPWWQRAAGAVRGALRRACSGLPADERGLLPGLVLGDVSQMPASLTSAFRTAGLTHLTAVSGSNVAIVVAAVAAMSRRVGLRRGLRPVVAGLALAGFVVLVRPSASVLRAGVMGAVALGAMLLGRRARPLPALATAVLLLVLVDPFLARDAGFALSVLATAAIVVLGPPWTAALSRRLPVPLAASIAVPVAAQLACTPVIVGVFGQLTPWAVPANLLAAPAVAPATLLGIACAVVAVVTPTVAGALAWVATVPVWWLAVVARTLAALPGAGLGWPRGAAGLALLAAAGGALVGVVRVARRARGRAILCRWPP